MSSAKVRSISKEWSEFLVAVAKAEKKLFAAINTEHSGVTMTLKPRVSKHKGKTPGWDLKLSNGEIYRHDELMEDLRL